jgi:hypothetical protein
MPDSSTADYSTNEAIRPHADISRVRRALTERYLDVHRKNVEDIIEKCRIILKGKEKLLAHGEFGPWVTDDLKLGRNLKSSLTVAEMMMQIAKDEVLTDSNYWLDFPPHWRTLYELVHIQPERKWQLIADGQINPGMTQDDAKALCKGRSQDRPQFILSAAILRLRLECERLGDETVNELLTDPGKLTPDELEEFAHELVMRASQWREAQ